MRSASLKEATHSALQAHDAARVVEEALAVLGEPRGAPVALEDGAADALLEPLHLHRHGALGLVHDVGGPGEGAGVGDGDEGAELVDVEEVHGPASDINARDATYLNHSLLSWNFACDTSSQR